jgi:serine/threonine-protein kinase
MVLGVRKETKGRKVLHDGGTGARISWLQPFTKEGRLPRIGTRMTNRSLSREKLAEASFLIRDGRSAEAIPILDAIVAVEPGCTWALEERGRAKMFIEDYEGAIADFSLMIVQRPASPKGFTCRADARARAGDLQGALVDYSSAIAIDPGHPYAYLQRGRLRFEIREYAAAISDFTADMEVSPQGRLSGLLNRGTAKHFAGDLSGAISDLTEAITLEVGMPVFGPLFRGRARLTAGDYHGAINDFTSAITALPGLTNAYRYRAEARELIGDRKGAADDRSLYDQLGGRDLPAFM